MELFIGDREQIKQAIANIAKENNLPVKYSTNIFYDLSKQYGLFYKPSLLYFIFSPQDFPNADSVARLKQLAIKSKTPVICIIEEQLDKRGSFYKTFGKQIKYIGKQKLEVDKVQEFYNNIEAIKNIETKEAVSFLYRLFYDFKHQQYKSVAGYCINLVLTGQVKTDLILKVFLAEILNKGGK